MRLHFINYVILSFFNIKTSGTSRSLENNQTKIKRKMQTQFYLVKTILGLAKKNNGILIITES